MNFPLLSRKSGVAPAVAPGPTVDTVVVVPVAVDEDDDTAEADVRIRQAGSHRSGLEVQRLTAMSKPEDGVRLRSVEGIFNAAVR